MLIKVITPQLSWREFYSDFAPLKKWNRNFIDKGIRHEYVNILDDENVVFKGEDVVIIDYRWVQRREKTRTNKLELKLRETPDYVFKLIRRYSEWGVKVIFFDTRDSPGSESLDLLPYVDSFWKKQIFKDFSNYTETKPHNFMTWLPTNLPDTRDAVFKPAESEHLSKLKLAWNIGMCDFREVLISSKIPVSLLSPDSILAKLKLNRVKLDQRKYLLSYRGSSNKHPSYDWQRNLVKKRLRDMQAYNVIVGDKVGRGQYMKEQLSSIATVSPFGWGEICYRDFESIMNGSLLLKPSMKHIDTYPSWYQPNKTYIPLKWDVEDLKEMLLKAQQSTDECQEIVKTAQELFYFHQNSFEAFYNHYCKLISD